MEEASSEEIEEVKPAKPSKKGLESLNIEELNKILNEALANEDYERAAKIRDELGKRG
jgi:uncharacterized protein